MAGVNPLLAAREPLLPALLRPLSGADMRAMAEHGMTGSPLLDEPSRRGTIAPIIKHLDV